MRIFLWIIILVLSGISPVSAQFNKEEAAKSLVKIIVTNGTKAGVCSGFTWQKKSWVVTSLHAMKSKTATIEVVYPGGNLRDAKVIKVFKSADLVLLETNIEAKPVANAIIAIEKYAAGKPAPDEKMYAIGYPGGAKGYMKIPLTKGDVETETLEFLVREKDFAAIEKGGIPSMKIPIYFVTGNSLLPGFSGSPVFNAANELVGIGDGGLEEGRMNVSWCIPASNLDNLLASQVTTLPDNIAEVSQHYTAEVSIDVKPDDEGINYQEAQEELDKQYKSYDHAGFEFYQTKTRTLHEMAETAIDNQNLFGFAKEFNEKNILFNYNSFYFDFDIYEDVNKGFLLAIPQGTTLTYDSDLTMFTADLPDDDPNAGYFKLLYGMGQHEGDPVGELIKGLTQAFGTESQGMTLDNNYSRSSQLNQEWRADYFVLQGNAPYQFNANETALINMFVSIISNKDEAFYSIALCAVPVENIDIQIAFVNGIDCRENYNAGGCAYFSWFFHVIAASQLTSLSFR